MKSNSLSHLRVPSLFFTIALAISACSPAITPAPAGQSPSPKQESTARPAEAAAIPVKITPEKAEVGQQVEAVAAGLPAGARVAVNWETVEGGWLVEDYYHFKGKKYSVITQPLGEATVGVDGRLSYRFAIPEDYGGVHNVNVVAQTFVMNPTEGPIGTPIEIKAKGLGWQTMESVWAVNWDNREVGWVSAASSRGSATARFRATGPFGNHEIKVYSGYMSQPYLNYEQAPTAYLPRPRFVFRTIAGGQVPTAFVEPYQPQPVPAAQGTGGAKLELSSTQGPVLSKTALKASGLPANQSLSLIWQTWVGSRVAETGFAPKETELSKVAVGADGRLDLPVTVPDDLGGLHALLLKSGDAEVARAYYVIETSIVSMSPSSGPAGTPVSIHLKGVGWTEYDNVLMANYDNGYMGYACGFNSQGDVVINFTASGEPGTHLIDLYPGIYNGPKDAAQQLYRLPQLTYAEDHPGNRIPALRLAFQVTG